MDKTQQVTEKKKFTVDLLLAWFFCELRFATTRKIDHIRHFDLAFVVLDLLSSACVVVFMGCLL